MFFNKDKKKSEPTKSPKRNQNKQTKNPQSKPLSVDDILKTKKTLNVTGNRALSDAYLNTFFKLFSAEQIIFIEELYLDLKPSLDKLKISGESFMQHAKEAYMRYQEYKQIDAFQPMDKKGQRYVEESLRKIISKLLKMKESETNDSK